MAVCNLSDYYLDNNFRGGINMKKFILIILCAFLTFITPISYSVQNSTVLGHTAEDNISDDDESTPFGPLLDLD